MSGLRFNCNRHEVQICYERAESLCHSLNRPLLLYSALMGQWRYSLFTEPLTAAMQVAKRVHSLAQQQNDSALLMGAYQALVSTLSFLGDFEVARQYAIRGVELWRSGTVRSPIEQVDPPALVCLGHNALIQWHFGEIAFCQATMAEAISLAKELNDMHGLGRSTSFCRDTRMPET
jgi:hypothetical protein